MGRISNYSQDTNVTRGDKLLGSDSGGSTKNFSLESISGFFKNTNSAGVVGQFVWQYKNSSPIPLIGELNPTFSSGVTFGNLQSLLVSKYIYDEAVNSIGDLLSIYESQDIIIVDTANQNNFAVYTADTITATSSNHLSSGSAAGDMYTITLSNKTAANGSFVLNNYYSIMLFNAGGGDKTYIHNQNSGAATWNVTHNLGKRPSVTVVDVNNVQGYGIVTHTNANALTITFPGSTTGKAYCN